MIVLGIESSCDETACALVEDGHKVLSSIVSSQIDIHKIYGGVIPEIAARAHLDCFPAVLSECLEKASLSSSQLIDAIAVTQGPGLQGALLVGVSYAKGLAYKNQLPLIPVDHIHAHIYGALLEQMGEKEFSKEAGFFPSLALVVSGGHTNLFLLEDRLSFRVLASSRDDACGECFDKVAKLMGFEYPGGPKIEKIAVGANDHFFDMPKVRIHSELGEGRVASFSYSGLKTHIVNLVRGKDEVWWEENRARLAASFQRVAFEQIRWVVDQAMDKFPKVQNLIVAGGVAANNCFREQLTLVKRPLKVYWPKLKYCSDNAAMIAGLGYYQYQSTPNQFNPVGNWETYARFGSGLGKGDH